MSRSRCTLHKSKLNEFRDWLIQRGWKEAKPKGDYEVLRMRWKREPPLLIYDRLESKEHYTTYDIGETLVRQWIRERKGG